MPPPALRFDHARRAPLQDPDRPESAMLTATDDGTDAPYASSGEEVVVAEEVAAFLVRQRAAVVIEIIEGGDPDREVG
jgi:hypothetical protein